MIFEDLLKSYLDEENLNNLSQAELARILSIIMHKHFTLLRLWKYHSLFLKLEEATYMSNPVLLVGLIVTHMMKGNLNLANELIDKLPKNSVYPLYTKLFSPAINNDEFVGLINVYKELRLPPDKNLSLTAGRPSLLNGFRDLTSFAKDLEPRKEELLSMMEVLYGDEATHIHKISLAETLFMKDECYEALILVVSAIPFLEEKKDIRILFVALYLQIMILLMNGQIKSTAPMISHIIERTHSNDMDEWIPNVKALEAWISMYEGNYKKMIKWLKDEAPDEHGDFTMLDSYRYLIKIRGYIITQKHLAVTSLANKLLPVFRQGNRFMDECELQILWGISDYLRGDLDQSLNHISRAIEISKEYRYDRLFANEGEKVYKLLQAYKKRYGKEKYLDKLIHLSQKTLLLYPNYLKEQLPNTPSLTKVEVGVLKLLADGRSNDEICELLDITINTTKSHTKNIFKKLNVDNRYKAVNVAKEYGII